MKSTASEKCKAGDHNGSGHVVRRFDEKHEWGKYVDRRE
jgi:hypothetical protein